MSNYVDKFLMTEEAGKQIAASIDRQNMLLTRMINAQEGATPVTTLQEIHRIVQAGEAPGVFGIGDQIMLNYNDGAESYVLPWDIVHFGNVELADGETVPGMFLQSHYAMEACQFDGNEAFYVADEALPVGTYYVTFGTTWGTNVHEGDSYAFALTHQVPAGGMLLFGKASSTTGALPDTAPADWRVWSYESQTATTPLEIVSLALGAAGTNLGTISAATKYGADGLNQLHRCAYGYNRWSQSALRQRLNSAGAAGTWWTPQNRFDRAPDQLAALPGFMAGFDQEFLAIIKPVKVRTALNTVTDSEIGTYEDTYDTFFLASLEQEYIVPQLANTEGEAWDYWKQRLGIASPQVTGNAGINSAHIRYGYNAKSSAQYCRLRSATRGLASYAWGVYTSGYANSIYATYAYRCAPACVIC
jgi:hypothetical protein